MLNEKQEIMKVKKIRAGKYGVWIYKSSVQPNFVVVNLGVRWALRKGDGEIIGKYTTKKSALKELSKAIFGA